MASTGVTYATKFREYRSACLKFEHGHTHTHAYVYIYILLLLSLNLLSLLEKTSIFSAMNIAQLGVPV